MPECPTSTPKTAPLTCAGALAGMDRPRRTRTAWSRRLTTGQVHTIQDAAGFSNEIARPCNLALTIAWAALVQAGDRDGDCSLLGLDPITRDTALRQKIQSFFSRRGVPTVHLWVVEMSARHGRHLHLAIHVPEAHLDAFLARCGDWFGAKGRWRPSDLEPYLLCRSDCRGWHAARIGRGLAGLKDWVAYLCKGQDDAQGLVHGKRCGTSRAIGTTARARWRSSAECRQPGPAPKSHSASGCAPTRYATGRRGTSSIRQTDARPCWQTSCNASRIRHEAPLPDRRARHGVRTTDAARAPAQVLPAGCAPSPEKPAADSTVACPQDRECGGEQGEFPEAAIRATLKAWARSMNPRPCVADLVNLSSRHLLIMRYFEREKLNQIDAEQQVEAGDHLTT